MRVCPGLYEFSSGPARMIVADVEAHGGELRGWCEFFHGAKRLHAASYNLYGPRTVGTMASIAARRVPTFRFDWEDWLSECCYEVIHDTLEGEPPVELTTADAQPPAWIVQDLVGDDGATSLVGFGQTGKSMIALACACSVASGDDVWLGLPPVQSGPVLYLDWEASVEPHRWRLAQLCQGARRDPPKGIYHRRESLPLYRSVTAVARHAAQVRAKLLIVDSVMLARGGSDTFGHEGTLSLYAALARIGRPTLLIDHRPKPSRDPKVKSDPAPWGSVINFNSLRLAWSVNTQANTDGIDIALKRIKSNYHGKAADLGWRLMFSDGNRSARFERATGPLLPGGEGTTTDKIMGLLLREGQLGCTVKDLAIEVGTSESSVRGLLSRLKAQGKVRSDGGVWLAESQDRQEEAPF